ncbi:hypothetical protein NHQ30_007022 [Ciborinia camelliae]|nr:hypothetical protein NHQ30_007022 [Ciborinia camelliae]
MAENQVVPDTLAPFMEKFIALEAKYSALEERFNKLHENASVSKPIAPSTSEIVAQITSIPTPTSTTTQDTSLEKTALAVPCHPGHPPSRAKIVISKIDKETGERKDHPANEAPSAPSEIVEKFHAFILRKIIADQDQDEENESEIEITSEDLWKLLKQLLGHWPGHTFDGSPVVLFSPYEPFVLYWDDLQAAAEKETEDATDKQARDDLKLLLDTISSGSGDAKLDKYFKSRKSNMDQKIVTYETLWTIFPPGTLVYGRFFLGEDQVLLVFETTRLWPRDSHHGYWKLIAWTYDWDGKMFRRSPVELFIESFEGQKAISSLTFFPLQFHEDCKDVEKRLIERGRKFRNACTTKNAERMFDYGGRTIFEQRGFSGGQDDDDKDDDMSRSSYDFRSLYHYRATTDISTAAPKPIDGRVMIDFESYFRYGPAFGRIGSLTPQSDLDECGCHACRTNDPLREKFRTRFDEEANQRDNWHDEQYMLCPPRVLGYILRDKQWAQLQVTALRNIPRLGFRNSWSERLKLADGEVTKNIILDLVSSHGTKTEGDENNRLEVDDIVANKGKGLVILLYGESQQVVSNWLHESLNCPPGVGKTTTAETVAIAARKPLFSISVADVGDKAKKVEKNLAKIFSLASSWQAILLIAWLSFLKQITVFLRVLEYYQGILMLTTNQIAQFDVAIKSRIHVAFKYNELNPKQTLDIFNGFLEPLNEKGLIKNMGDITEWLNEDVVKMGLDGRQIRNIVTSAVGLARAEAKGQIPKLNRKHLKAMVSNVKEFKDEFIAAYERYKTSQSGSRANH